MELTQIAYFQILGKPLMLHLGILGLLFILFAAATPWLSRKGIAKISLQWHTRLAAIGIILSLLHAILGISVYL